MKKVMIVSLLTEKKEISDGGESMAGIVGDGDGDNAGVFVVLLIGWHAYQIG